MTYKRLTEILKLEIKFQDWEFVSGPNGTGWFLQVSFIAPDSANLAAGPVRQKGRKWIISRHAIKQEVVQTAFKAVMAAIEHETREQFKYNDVAIFNPHIDLEALWFVAKQQVHRLDKGYRISTQ